MFKLYTFAAIVLFWVTLSVALLRVQLAASSVYKVRMRVPTYRSMLIRPSSIAQVKSVVIATSYD